MQFQLKQNMVQILHSNVQFNGLPYEYPQLHLSTSIKIITDIFLCSLMGAARRWLGYESSKSITTLEFLMKKFSSRYNPSRKTAKLRDEITNIAPKHREDKYQACARVRQMWNSYPHQMQTNDVLSHAFFEVLEYNVCALLHNTIRAQTLSITSESFFDFLNKLLEGNQGYDGDICSITTQKPLWIFDVDQVTALNTKVDAMQLCMTLQFKHMDLNQAPVNFV